MIFPILLVTLIATIFVIEYMIESFKVRIALLLTIVLVAAYLSSNLNLKVDTVSERDYYVRGINTLMKKLHELSETNQHELLKRYLSKLSKELPMAMLDRVKFAILLNQLDLYEIDSDLKPNSEKTSYEEKDNLKISETGSIKDKNGTTEDQ